MAHDAPGSDWIATDRSRQRARANSFLRHPIEWLRHRGGSQATGMSATYDVPHSRAEVLRRLVELPVSTWTYGWEHETVKHMGPMAQDFAKAFGLGDTDRSIANVDSAGVLMAAVQALHARVVELEAEVTALKSQIG